MLEFDTYREVLIEHGRGRHLVRSAWVIVIAVVVALSDVLRPMALGFKSDEIRRSLTIEDARPVASPVSARTVA